MGNLTFQFSVNTPLLSCLNHVYDFMAASYERRQKLWKSVLFELRIASGLLVFCRSELDRLWHARALMVDSFPCGYSVAERQPDVELTRAVGDCDERWRFRRGMDIGAREHFAFALASRAQ